MGPGHQNPLLLAVDSGSPTVSVAVGYGHEILSERSARMARSSGNLLQLVADTLSDAACTMRDIEGLLGLRGPGSFTGLRVGLATLLGLHQAVGVAATAISTFAVLASLAPPEAGTVLAAVDALHGRWLVQPFPSGEPLHALAPPQSVEADRLADLKPAVVIGFGASRLATAIDESETIRLVEPPPLAAPAIRSTLAREPDWDAATLLEPLYLQTLSYKELGE